ncbi:MAG: hypothetical protein RMA76_35635 [Deltaproteobacteria bacterium]
MLDLSLRQRWACDVGAESFSSRAITRRHANCGVHLKAEGVARLSGRAVSLNGVVGRGAEPAVEGLLVLVVLLEIAMLFEPSRESTLHLVFEVEEVVGRGAGIDAELELVADLDVRSVQCEHVKVRKERERLGESLHHDDCTGVRGNAHIDAPPDRIEHAAHEDARERGQGLGSSAEKAHELGGR